MNTKPRVILEKFDGTQVEGYLYGSNPLTGIYTLRLDNGLPYQAQGTISRAPLVQEKTEKKTLLQRVQAFFTR